MTTTQNERLLEYLADHQDGIDPMTAWCHLGIYRLGARIWDLRKQGHAIEADTVEVHNRFGEACRVARYRLLLGVAE
jgi:hypothetical protein